MGRHFGAVLLCMCIAACSGSSSGSKEGMDGSVDRDGGGNGNDNNGNGNGGEDDAGGSDAGDSTGSDAGDGGGNVPKFACTGIDAVTISTTVASAVHATGILISADATLVVRAIDDGSVALTVAADEVQSGAALFTIEAGVLEAGLYAVELTSAGEASSCGALGVTNLPPPSITAVTPDSASIGVLGDGVLNDRTVTITGTGFQDTPSVILMKRGDVSQRYLAEQVSFVSTTQITAVIPSESLGMAIGEYDVILVNPDGLRGIWIPPFHVLGAPPPQVFDVDPARGASASTQTITLKGANFSPTAQVAIDYNGVLYPLAFNAGDTQTDDKLVVTLSAGALGIPQGQHAIRVTNPDGQFDVFFAYNVTASSDAKLDSFSETAGVTLNTARYRLASTVGFDASARGYVYVGGGIDSTGNALASVESIEVSGLGQHAAGVVLQQWTSAGTPRAANQFVTARAGHSMVRVGRYLYALGGASSNTHVATPAANTLLSSIERAKILDFDEQPAMYKPRDLGGAGLPLGNWYYRVSALGPWGESLASREVQVPQTDGVVRVCWGSVSGATSYNLYRSLASDGRGGTTRLLAKEVVGTEQTGGVRCADDNGKGLYQPAPGRLNGTAKTALETAALGAGLTQGYWIYRVSAVVGGVETVAGYRAAVQIADATANHVVLRWDPVVGATYNLYRVAAVLPGAPTGSEETHLIASNLSSNRWVDDGSATVEMNAPAPGGVRALSPGSLSLWQTLPVSLPEAREGLDALSLTVPRVDRSGAEPAVVGLSTYIYAAGGRLGTTVNESSVYLASVLRVEVDTATGDLIGPFKDAGGAMTSKRAFFPLLTNIGQRDAVRPPRPEEPPCTENDGDGHLPPRCGGNDCNDNDPSIYPGAPEICGDGIDQDCDGSDPMCTDNNCPRDQDGDGVQPVACGGCDCDDNNPAVHCGAIDMCGDGIDQNCDGSDPSCEGCVDGDGDGKLSIACGGCDCNDADNQIFCGQPESCATTRHLCDDGIDQDCDGSDCHCPIILLAPVLNGAQADFSAYDPNQTVLLIAVAGDDTYNDGNNDGLSSFEVTGVSTDDAATHGDTLGWTAQTNGFSNGAKTLGHDAVLYFDYLFPFYGVSAENRSTQTITPRNSASPRWPFVENPSGAPLSASYVGSFQSTSSSWTARTYYTMQRINGGVFVLGGHSGVGPMNNIGRTLP